MTDRAEYVFTVKESADQRPFLMLEPRSKNLPVFEGGFLCLELEKGASFGEAEVLSNQLNQKIVSVSFTK